MYVYNPQYQSRALQCMSQAVMSRVFRGYCGGYVEGTLGGMLGLCEDRFLLVLGGYLEVFGSV